MRIALCMRWNPLADPFARYVLPPAEALTDKSFILLHNCDAPKDHVFREGTVFNKVNGPLDFGLFMTINVAMADAEHFDAILYHDSDEIMPPNTRELAAEMLRTGKNTLNVPHSVVWGEDFTAQVCPSQVPTGPHAKIIRPKRGIQFSHPMGFNFPRDPTYVGWEHTMMSPVPLIHLYCMRESDRAERRRTGRADPLVQRAEKELPCLQPAPDWWKQYALKDKT